MARRPGIIASLLVTAVALLACGGTTTIVQGGSPGAAATATNGATATPVPPTATATPDPGRYDGTWVDDAAGAGTYGSGELVVTNTGAVASVHGYGLCGTKCDWGTSSATTGPYTLVVTYTFGSTESATLTLQLQGSGLKVEDADTHFGTQTYTMHRASPTEQRAFLYAGAWINNDPHTSGIPEVLIAVNGTKLTVHGYGACSPSYCDWGTQTGTYAGDPFKVVFSLGGGTITNSLSLSLLDAAGDSLQIVEVGSASGTNTYTFHKSSIA